MGDSGLCFVCPESADELCSECETVSFCRNHKTYHKDEDIGGCFPYLLAEEEGVGRILRATRDIEPGEMVFREKELVVGPCRTSRPQCIGCGRKVTCEMTCSCSWPVCSNSCSEMFRHSKEECDILSAGERPDFSRNCDDYRGLLPLRVLLLPVYHLQYFLQFMDHCDDRNEDNHDLIDLIRNRWKQDRFDGGLISRVDGILDVNSVEHRVQGESESARGFLPITSLASHSCISNSIKDKTTAGFVTTRARVLIRAGEEITFHYTGGLKGRNIRRPTLRAGWFFLCECTRCSSSSELGSELSSLLCQVKDCSGIVRPVNPCAEDSQYRCDECSDEVSYNEVMRLEQGLTASLENCYVSDTVSLEGLLDTSTTAFHNNHYLRLIMKWLLITSWGQRAGLENGALTSETLRKKVVLAREYLSSMDILDPGISHNRGLTLWEIHSAQTFLLNRLFKEEKISAEKFLEGLKESREIVHQVIWCLQYNQVHTAEFKIRTLAVSALENLQNAINFFSSVLNKSS